MRVSRQRVHRLASGAIVLALLLTPAFEASRAVDPVETFSLPFFPIGIPGVNAYNAPIVAALDHSSTFYTQCCDTTITAYTGETVTRGPSALGCPVAPEFPACFVAPNCICSYADPEGDPFIVNGNYVGAFGASVLLYDGHPGYDYGYGFDTPLVATRDGQLCKAVQDEINGTRGAASAWEGFHTFYIDHGTFGEKGYASWYLHATDLDGTDTSGRPLDSLGPGSCAPVVAGQMVARVGNFGTFLPHLHFEVRIYTPILGPEQFAQVIDPYGWTGEVPDPWAQGTNGQAVSRLQALWVPEPSRGGCAAAALISVAALRRYRRGREIQSLRSSRRSRETSA